MAVAGLGEVTPFLAGFVGGRIQNGGGGRAGMEAVNRTVPIAGDRTWCFILLLDGVMWYAPSLTAAARTRLPGR